MCVCVFNINVNILDLSFVGIFEYIQDISSGPHASWHSSTFLQCPIGPWPVLSWQEVWAFSEEDRELMMDSFGSVGSSMLLEVALQSGHLRGFLRMLVWWSDKPPWRCELLIDHFTCTLDQWEVFLVRCQGYPCTSPWLVATTGLCTTSSWHKSARFILQSSWAIPSSLFLLPSCNGHIRPGKLGHTESDDARCSLDTWGPLQHLDGSVRCNSPQTSEV